MAKYTVELKTLIDSGFPLGMDEYPIFDDAYRNVLNRKILDHYMFREIGQETAERFKFYLNRKLDEVMPYYNDLYNSAKLEYNPLFSTNFSETFTKSGTGSQDENGTVNNASTENSEMNREMHDTGSSEKTSEQSVNTDKTNLDKYSDTPQSYLQNVTDGRYLTNARDVEGTENQEASGKDTTINSTNANQKDATASSSTMQGSSTKNRTMQTTEEYIRTVTGHNGQFGKSLAQLVIEYRKTLLNIDMLVVNEMEELFMGIW